MYIPMSNDFLKNREGYDRYDFPEGFVRASAGLGGEAILIIGKDKIALHDLGMACFSDRLISNLHEILDKMGRSLDYILLSHTHYDHIGALPYVIKEFPNAVVCGSPICEKVFKSETAISVMENLGKEAAHNYNKEDVEITARGLRVDKLLNEGDEIDLGDKVITAYEAKGHTDCSLAFLITDKFNGKKVLITNESTGLYHAPRETIPAILKEYSQSFEAALKLKSLNADTIIAMHYGVVDSVSQKTFFDDYINAAKEEEKLIQDAIKKGLSDEEVLEIHSKKYFFMGRDKDQPYAAYKTNAMVTITKQRKLLGM